MGPNTQKMAVGFIVYKPELSFYERLNLINAAGIPFFIYDNSPEFGETKCLADSYSLARYLSSGKNAGLGVGLSDLCQVACKENFEVVLFFDQDTVFNLETISYIKNYLHKFKLDLEVNYSAIAFSGVQSNNSNSDENEMVADVDLIINSGSLFFLKNIEKIGWHNKSYFVDGVDYEFCLRSHAAGFKTGKHLNTPFFDHETEQPDKIIKIFGKRLLIRKYSVSRMKDASSSYFRLIYSALSMGQIRFAILFSRSFLIYIFGQILARTIR